ncbi:MAG: hypothetical protein FJX00_02350 [Alphaproteobacteria bacterium]|nr:hypothetical protein [Alphaproteobacteria bacterium]
MECVKNSDFLNSLGCPRRRDGIRWCLIIVLTLGAALVGARPPGATIASGTSKPSLNSSRSMRSLRAIHMNMKQPNFYNTTTYLTLNMTNHLQNATISGSSVGNGVLNARSIAPFAGQS